jgi:branched-chain amino acid transport system permease protein
MVRSTTELQKVVLTARQGLRRRQIALYWLSRLLLIGVSVFLGFLVIRNITPQAGAAPEYQLDQFIRQIIFGLAQGSIYGLIALGITLIYGVIRTIHFAHGEVFMLGTYTSFFCAALMQQARVLETNTVLSLIFVLAVSVLVSMSVALALERLIFRALPRLPRLPLIVAGVGASIALQQLARHLFGESPRRFPDVSVYALQSFFPQQGGIDLVSGYYTVSLFGLEQRIVPVHLLVFGLSLSAMLAVVLYIQHSKQGRTIRAVSADSRAASLVGVDVQRTVTFVFALSGALAGLAAMLFSLYEQQITPYTGFLPGIKGIAVALLGGMGNVPGAIVGGLVLGMAESTLPSMLGMPTQLKDLVAFIGLILALIIRPNGVFGDAVHEQGASS